VRIWRWKRGESGWRKRGGEREGEREDERESHWRNRVTWMTRKKTKLNGKDRKTLEAKREAEEEEEERTSMRHPCLPQGQHPLHSLSSEDWKFPSEKPIAIFSDALWAGD
jgi:hypothetical protein